MWTVSGRGGWRGGWRSIPCSWISKKSDLDFVLRFLHVISLRLKSRPKVIKIQNNSSRNPPKIQAKSKPTKSEIQTKSRNFFWNPDQKFLNEMKSKRSRWSVRRSLSKSPQIPSGQPLACIFRMKPFRFLRFASPFSIYQKVQSWFLQRRALGPSQVWGTYSTTHNRRVGVGRDGRVVYGWTCANAPAAACASFYNKYKLKKSLKSRQNPPLTTLDLTFLCQTIKTIYSWGLPSSFQNEVSCILGVHLVPRDFEIFIIV